MIVVPLARTAAIRAFSVAPTLGNSSSNCVAVELVGPSLDVAVGELEGGAELLQRPQVHVDGSGPEVVASGKGDPRSPEAGQQGTEDHDRRPHPLDDLVGRLRREVAVVRQLHDVGVGPGDRNPDG